jgi:hypothetical protein
MSTESTVCCGFRSRRESNRSPSAADIHVDAPQRLRPHAPPHVGARVTGSDASSWRSASWCSTFSTGIARISSICRWVTTTTTAPVFTALRRPRRKYASATNVSMTCVSRSTRRAGRTLRSSRPRREDADLPRRARGRAEGLRGPPLLRAGEHFRAATDANDRHRMCHGCAMKRKEPVGAKGTHRLYEDFCGGAEGNRTPGLNSAIVALYQLSYSPAAAPSVAMRSARTWGLAGCSEVRRRASPGSSAATGAPVRVSPRERGGARARTAAAAPADAPARVGRHSRRGP